MLTLTFVIGLISVALCCLLAFALPFLYNISAELKLMATRLGCVLALFSPLSFVYAMCFFCLRAGGDIRNATLLDSGFMWILPIPISVLMALFMPGKISILVAVIIVQIAMNLRIVPALRILAKGTWVRNLTLDDVP